VRIDKQIGLEKSIAVYIQTLLAVFGEVWRVLRDDGTCWVEIGDSFSGSNMTGGNNGINASGGANGFKIARQFTSQRGTSGLKPKDKCLIPFRFAIAMQEAGWYVRQDNIWHRPNPMPESVTDRSTTSHSYVFQFAKQGKYFYDGEAIREAHVDPLRGAKLRTEKYGGGRVPGRENEKFVLGWRKKEESWNPNGRNMRSVWTIPTEPSTLQHFAMMPTELAKRCIKAGCPKGGIVFDPFGGPGTTALVADRLGRHAISLELSRDTCLMAKERIGGEVPLFAAVAVAAAVNEQGGLF